MTAQLRGGTSGSSQASQTSGSGAATHVAPHPATPQRSEDSLAGAGASTQSVSNRIDEHASRECCRGISEVQPVDGYDAEHEHQASLAPEKRIQASIADQQDHRR